MNGQALSGSRKLNHHWQSAGDSRPNYFETGTLDQIYLAWNYTGLPFDNTFRLRQRVEAPFKSGAESAVYEPVKFIGSDAPRTSGVPGKVSQRTIITPIYEGSPGALKITFNIKLPDTKQYYIIEATDGNFFSGGTQGIRLLCPDGSGDTFCFTGEVYMENPPEVYYHSSYDNGSGKLSTLTPEDISYGLPMYPVTSGGVISIYLPRKITTYTINPFRFMAGLYGLTVKADFDVSAGKDNYYTVYKGDNTKIKYGIKYTTITAEEWADLRPSLYRT